MQNKLMQIRITSESKIKSNLLPFSLPDTNRTSISGRDTIEVKYSNHVQTALACTKNELLLLCVSQFTQCKKMSSHSK
jgi:hypothetical protein